ncbi:MAG: thiamine pyrophosphate-binding protein, partial [Gammaproteobacteria bacterium]
PGTTNLITGVASAYADEVPLLVITAQTALPSFGKGAFQESSSNGVDTVGMLEHCTRYNSLVSHPEQLEGKLISAVMTAHEPPMGPVHLSIPRDVLASPSPVKRPNFHLDLLLQPPSLVDEEGVKALWGAIQRARKKVIIVGSGCGEAGQAIVQLAEGIDAALIATPQGKAWVSPYHPRFRGIFGFAGHKSAREALLDPEVDLILAIGTTMDEWATSGWDQEALLNSKLIHVDNSPLHLTRSPMARLHVRGRILTTLEHLLEMLPGRPSLPLEGETGSLKVDLGLPAFALDEERKCLTDSAPVKPQRLMHLLPRLFPPKTRFLADTGNSFAWSTHYLHPFATHTYRVAMGFGSMAWAIGSAVGTAMGAPGTPVVSITGDGSFLMSGQEITVAVQERLPVIFVVLNDNALGMVKHGQRLGGAEQVGSDLPPVDFCAMARALGAEAHIIRHSQDLFALDIEAICSCQGPTLLDIHVDPEEVPPMGVRMKVLSR